MSAIIEKWRTAPSPSLPSLKGIHKLSVLGGGGVDTCAEAVQKQKGFFFSVAAVAGINMRLNKELWQKLGESICMSPEADRDWRGTDRGYWLAAIVTFF